MVLHIIKLPFGINPCPLSFAMDSSIVMAFILKVGLKWADGLWLVNNLFSFLGGGVGGGKFGSLGGKTFQ